MNYQTNLLTKYPWVGYRHPDIKKIPGSFLLVQFLGDKRNI